LIAICCVIEFGLIIGGLERVGLTRLRLQAYEYFGFWPGLLQNWRPNYPAQPYSMFVTYGFFHSGLFHLLVNMVTLLSLGRPILDRVGQRAFALLYFGSCFGGAAGFALLAPDLRPMVGASGALFGLAGGYLAWAYVDRYFHNERLWPIARSVLLLAGLNLVLWWAMDGQMAWQAHLGGFLAGWLLAILIDPRPLEER
jgi:membrane associated rhomboid family serine protease